VGIRKLVGLDIDENSAVLLLQVSNRQRSHVVQPDDLGVLALTIEAALASFQGRPPPTLDLPPDAQRPNVSALEGEAFPARPDL
jgi:hypothetical protein